MAEMLKYSEAVLLRQEAVHSQYEVVSRSEAVPNHQGSVVLVVGERWNQDRITPPDVSCTVSAAAPPAVDEVFAFPAEVSVVLVQECQTSVKDKQSFLEFLLKCQEITIRRC